MGIQIEYLSSTHVQLFLYVYLFHIHWHDKSDIFPVSYSTYNSNCRRLWYWFRAACSFPEICKGAGKRPPMLLPTDILDNNVMSRHKRMKRLLKPQPEPQTWLSNVSKFIFPFSIVYSSAVMKLSATLILFPFLT